MLYLTLYIIFIIIYKLFKKSINPKEEMMGGQEIRFTQNFTNEQCRRFRRIIRSLFNAMQEKEIIFTPEEKDPE